MENTFAPCLGYENVVVNAAGNAVLTVPNGALRAVITHLNAAATSLDDTCRLTQDGTNPSDTNGLPLGHMGSYEVLGAQNLALFKIRNKTTEPIAGALVVEYFGTV